MLTRFSRLTERKKMGLRGVSFVCFFFFVVLLQVSIGVYGRGFPSILSKPNHEDAVGAARWLASQNIWGVLSTISIEMKGAPFGNVVSFSDGLPDKGTGTPYFYLTTLDPTARNAMKDGRASFTVSEFPLGTCGKKDPENPSCAKLTLTGKLKLVSRDTKEAEFAASALFTKHVEMKGWPKGHNFEFYKLDIEDIFLINWFGGPKPITVAEYLHHKMDQLALVI